MGKPKDKLEIEVMKLPPENRAELAHRLIGSLEDTDVGDYEAEWVQEAERVNQTSNAHAADGRAQTW